MNEKSVKEFEWLSCPKLCYQLRRIIIFGVFEKWLVRF